jgi:hypothetical protein
VDASWSLKVNHFWLILDFERPVPSAPDMWRYVIDWAKLVRPFISEMLEHQ